ncbi:hypothetical protein [Candidatus Mycolicibacterium alkanivorans]|uniref:Uncharacterized protein n=1 Tax=Candidatus Mycolicibacterium alkanivorans TaxID=2954114 RepID=A0ABS9YSI6_9MYCO|nr:hypothetical protein [Candidatus Mycolicibacterium alkanivorans]MCI4673773.1 hypothetical protein [Candidatus Mycolicibacterium alkanivorans]
MGSSKYVGYVGGVAVAVGVGAAMAAAAQGTANADTDKPDSRGSADSSQVDAGPKKSEARAATGRTRPQSRLGDKSEGIAAPVTKPPTSTLASVAKPTAAAFEAAQVEKVQGLFASTRRTPPTTAAVTTGTTGTTGTAIAVDTAPSTKSATTQADATTPSVPWSPNPLRPMPPEPAPNDMPGPVWDLEQAVVNAFPDILQPVPREVFEAGYRATQMIPWVNIIVPFVNIGTNLPAALAGDKNATQRIINNLIVTIQPVAIAYYGYNEIADLLNVEQLALDLQTWAITTAWDVLDPFQLLHNRGQSGLPLSTTTPPAYPPATAAVALASATTPKASTATPNATTVTDPNPFRADDPWPTTMPDAVLATEQSVLAAWPAPLEPLAPLFREAYEAVYRASQIVPWVNVVVPVTNILPALAQAFQGDRSGAQVTINQLLLTTAPLALLYWGFDELADLLNNEETAATTRQTLVASLWDSLDPAGLLHVPGQSGIA